MKAGSTELRGEDLPPDELTVEKARELLATPAGMERELGADPASGNAVVAKNGRFGPYVTEVLPDDDSTPKAKRPKPRTASLFASMSIDTIALDEALQLLSLPRVVGVDDDGVEITAQNHGFAVDAPLDRATTTRWGEARVSHICLNDDVVEGLELTDQADNLLAFSVQYHPEAAAGPHDSAYLFDRFVDVMQRRKQGTNDSEEN